MRRHTRITAGLGVVAVMCAGITAAVAVDWFDQWAMRRRGEREAAA